MKNLTAFLICSASFIASLPGAVIVYDFNDPSSSSKKLTADKTEADAGDITASDFAGPGVAGVSASTDSAFLVSSATGTDRAAALADDDYFTFTLTPVSTGQTWQVNSFTFLFGASNNASPATTFNNEVFVQTSFGGTGTGNPTLTLTPSSTKSTDFNNGGNSLISATVDVSGITFSSASPLEVQFRFYDDQDHNSIFNRLDDINIDVSAVPEPSVALLAALGLAGLAFRRR